MMLDTKELGKRIHKLRCLRGITQEKLSEDIHISQDYVSKLEAGSRTCSLDILVSICEYFHVSADYLLWGYTGGRNYVQGEIRTIGEGLLELSKKL